LFTEIQIWEMGREIEIIFLLTKYEFVMNFWIVLSNSPPKTSRISIIFLGYQGKQVQTIKVQLYKVHNLNDEWSFVWITSYLPKVVLEPLKDNSLLMPWSSK